MTDLNHAQCEDIRRIFKRAFLDHKVAGGSTHNNDERLKRLLVEPILEVVKGASCRKERS
jgi:hypothetical protein